MKLLSLALLLMMSLGMVAFGQNAPPPTGPPPLEGIKTFLGLTDAQVEALRTIQQQFRTDIRSAHEEIALKERALRGLVEGGGSATEVGTLMLEIHALRKRIGTREESARSQALNVLNGPGQKEKLAQLEAAMRMQPLISQAMSLFLLKPGPNPAAGPGAGPMMPRGMMMERMRRPERALDR
jgi:hypothetical protein